MADEEAEKRAKEESPLMKEAHDMLVRWEQGDEEVRALWKKMNDWVYQGFDETYKAMGVGFDKIYYESETYLEGKAKSGRRIGQRAVLPQARRQCLGRP